MSDNAVPPIAVREPLRITGLDHVVLRVRDHQRAIRFYEDVLGCRVERKLESARLVQLRAGAAMIDLVEGGGDPADGPQPSGSPTGNPAGNMDHFAVRIADFDGPALQAYLQAHGIEGGEVRDRYGAEGTGPSLYIKDPDGNTVELKGPPYPK